MKNMEVEQQQGLIFYIQKVEREREREGEGGREGGEREGGREGGGREEGGREVERDRGREMYVYN